MSVYELFSTMLKPSDEYTYDLYTALAHTTLRGDKRLAVGITQVMPLTVLFICLPLSHIVLLTARVICPVSWSLKLLLCCHMIAVLSLHNI